MESHGKINKGTVVKSTGSWYNVRGADGVVTQCRIVGKFRLNKMILTNPVGVGDEVEWQKEGAGQGVIKKILPRRNYVVRQSPRQLHHLHLMAANIDQALLFVTVVEPMLKPGFIDRFLLTTEPHDVPVRIVFNKSDLYTPDALEVYESVRAVYTGIGYEAQLFSSVTGEGREELTNFLKDKITLVSGQSGVGKSTAVNALQPGLEIKIGELSGWSGKGQHTTTFAEMHPLAFGGSIIDTPGIKTLAFNNLELMDIAHNFREFFVLSVHCRFGGACLHLNEPDCAVKEALENGEVSPTRYDHYLQLMDEVKDTNYWERHKEL